MNESILVAAVIIATGFMAGSLGFALGMIF